MTEPVETPIVVPASAIPEATLTMVRYALVSLGGVFVSRGWLSDSDLNSLVGAVLIILPTAYGMWLTKRNNAKQQTMADKLPDSVAQVQS